MSDRPQYTEVVYKLIFIAEQVTKEMVHTFTTLLHLCITPPVLSMAVCLDMHSGQCFHTLTHSVQPEAMALRAALAVDNIIMALRALSVS